MRGLKTLLLGSGAAGRQSVGIAIATAQPQPAGNGVFNRRHRPISDRWRTRRPGRSANQPDLSGGAEALADSGRAIHETLWSGPTRPSELYTKIQSSMPADNPRTLSDQAVESLVAFIYARTAPPTGCSGAYRRDGDFRSAQVATGTGAPASGLPTQTAATGGTGPERLGTRRLLSKAISSNYVPVTDQMLLNPSPNDWLMVRGGYRGWSHSQLTKSPKQNVNQLQLAGCGR